MNNLELTSVLEVAVFGLAIAQALTILLTIRRERDVSQLRELVEEQRLRLIELRAWLAGRNASQTKQIASERETTPEPTAGAKAPESRVPMQEDDQPRITEDAAARAVKALEWQREVAARLHAGIRAEVPPIQQATTPADIERPSIAEDTFKWFKEDHNEPRETVEARDFAAKSGKEDDQRAHDTPEILPRPSTPHDELERITRAVTLLKEDVEKTSLMTRLNGKPKAEMK